MRYNTYRQYKTLSGVKKTSKLEMIKHLSRFTKNLIKTLPKDVFQKNIKNRPKVEYVFRVNKENVVEAAYLYLYKMNGPIPVVDEEIYIKLPLNYEFEYIFDGDFFHDNRLHVQFFNDQYVKLDFMRFTLTDEGGRITEGDLFADSITKFTWDGERFIANTIKDGNRNTILIPPEFDFAAIMYDVTGLDYDTITPVPATVLE